MSPHRARILRWTGLILFGGAIGIGGSRFNPAAGRIPPAILSRILSPLPAMASPNAAAADRWRVSPLETRVFGRNTWTANGPAALRVIVTDHDSGRPVPARVEVLLGPPGGGGAGSALPLFRGTTDALGTIDSSFRVTAVQPGPHPLTITVHSALGDDTVVRTVDVEPRYQMLMTADKPIYQPGQMIHLRVLARDMGTGGALSGQRITFEVEDARGNKVFKQKSLLSRFGVAGADFQLADEVNQGVFTLRAITGTGTQVEKTVNVSRYVLPKYRISLTTDKPYYLPGQTLTGTLRANYLFGKPVAGASVHIAVNTVDIGVTRLDAISVSTTADGICHFSTRLPDSFVGQPFEEGKAVVELAADVRDTADQEQQQNLDVPVVQDPLLIAVVPETRNVVAGVENRAWVAVATPDGLPVRHCFLNATVDGRPLPAVSTDDLGLAILRYVPNQGGARIAVTAHDVAGRTAVQRTSVGAAGDVDGLILRTDRTLTRVGETMHLSAISTVRSGTLYVDVVRDRQTILTRAVPVRSGVGRLNLPLTPDMAGTLEIHAYRILPDENIVRDTRTVIVGPADDLHMSLTTDRPVYRPGQEAALTLHVANRYGAPVSAAVGIAVVDESVFALSELQPGLEKVYFTLEQDLMTPKYEIQGLAPAKLLQMDPTRDPAIADSRQRAAAMLLSSAPPADTFDYQVDTYQERYRKMLAAAAAQLQQAYATIQNALERYRQRTGHDLPASESLDALVRNGYLNQSDLIDPWGRPYRADTFGSSTYPNWFALRSAGPDGIWGTADDQSTNQFRQGFGGFGGFGGGRGVAFADRAMVNGGAVEMDAMDSPMAATAIPQMAMRPVMLAESNGMAMKKAVDTEPRDDASSTEAPHVRQFFPETLYWNPSVITDAHGDAHIGIPIADSITTWRVSALANDAVGDLGSGSAPLHVFQDFFVDMDLPVAFTQDDAVTVPVAVYNYLPKPQTVTLTMAPEPWFELRGPARQSIAIGAGQVKVVLFPIVVRSIGHHALTVTAHGTSASDAERRDVDVLPDGKEVDVAFGDTLDGQASRRVDIPAAAIPNATALWVKLYPGTFSQVVDGLDGILRMPNGCFEQTSSTTYPNVLVLDYLKQTRKINPELQMKAEQLINIGYQRLVTFECRSHGFSWFGDEPAHQILTAYGLLEFSDMARVYDVDPALIPRTAQWLAGRQRPDGTWLESSQGIAEGIINRQNDALRSTAYVAWALAESGYRGPALDRGIDYVRAHCGEATDPYTLAVILNLLANVDRDGGDTASVAKRLIGLAHTTEKTAFWQDGPDAETFTGATAAGADQETTGLATYALAKWGHETGFLNRALTYLVQSRDSYGTWGSTQGTVWSLKALLYASRNASGAGSHGTVTITVNGKRIAQRTITPENADVMQQIRIPSGIGANDVSLRYQGDGSLVYQIAGRYYLPWSRLPWSEGGPVPPTESVPGSRALAIAVAYDKTHLRQNDWVTLTATIHNNMGENAEMPLIDLGVPPGFSVDASALEEAVAAHKISKYTIAARQVIIYLERLDANATLSLAFRLQARFPIHAKTPQSDAYPYYNPERASYSAPQELTVE